VLLPVYASDTVILADPTPLIETVPVMTQPSLAADKAGRTAGHKVKMSINATHKHMPIIRFTIYHPNI